MTKEHCSKTTAFLERHSTLLEQNDPHALNLLKATLPPSKVMSWAEQMAASERETERMSPFSAPMDKRPITPSPGEATDPTSEEFGRRLTELGKTKAVAAHVFRVGPEEALRWVGRYDAMPAPARCEICIKELPFAFQIKAHFESPSHQDKCVKLGEQIIAKAMERDRAELEIKESRSSRGPTRGGDSRPSSSLSSSSTHARIKSAPPLKDFPCAGYKCTGRVSVPTGQPNAVGHCSKCNFKQVAPAKA